jgi:hypothetical protein
MKKSELLQMVREVLAEMENEDLEEISVTGNVSGYNTPNAFKKTDGTDEDAEADAAYIRRITTGTGYTQVNEAVKQGKRYGNWSVTQYDPIKYDDLGSVSGGNIKLVNQEDFTTLTIQHDNALRGGKWWVSTKGKRVQDTKPETVIQKAIKLNEGMAVGHSEVRRVEKGLTSQKHKDELARLIKTGGIKTSSDLKNWRSSLNEDIKNDLSRLKKGDTIIIKNPDVKGPDYNTPVTFIKYNKLWNWIVAKNKDGKIVKIGIENEPSSQSYRIIKEATNRYHQLRKEEGTPNQKIGKGIRELRKQLSEIEKFVTWYGKIKNESGLDSANYWKRTQRHLSKISERLNKLSTKVRDLSV